ncbi:ArsR/SmtB family transcription factor [Subtercola endophyticus]|uniref:ArsR/SmtB family transcription factor n=1 Tax=Subtercola endophyticus TaxID=2895559 RepID=UPI001E64E226|nr:metalloregulator ArsR/SmtB family transcription factor [Subtercola endophyticus]UFS60512.1 metalloregulator ArsR/SmtB family transcription factor [Subtercola endophyticus]
MPHDQLDSVFSALADPTRRGILQRLTLGDATVAQLGEPFAVSQPAISKHLKVLEQAGLVSRTRVATSRLSHLEAQPLKEATAWMQRYKKYWNESFDKLDSALATFQATPSQPADGSPNTEPKGSDHE